MRAHEFIFETELIEGKWNEEFLKNLLRALVAGVIAYGGAEAKRLTTPLDTKSLDTLVKQLTPKEQNKIVSIAKNVKKSKAISSQDKLYLNRLIDKSVY